VADVFTKKKRSQVMAAIRSRGNKDTELKLASILRATGITGWRRHQPLHGRPDFIFRHARLAVFVDGCFWHGCPKHGRKPGSNRAYWLPKLRRNRERDAAVKHYLCSAGWTVIRLWEHDLANAQRCAARIRHALCRP
jgi:DNA mismatch endonuclease (patch repair protein)